MHVPLHKPLHKPPDILLPVSVPVINHKIPEGFRYRGEAYILAVYHVKGPFLVQAVYLQILYPVGFFLFPGSHPGQDGNSQASGHSLFDGLGAVHAGNHVHIFKDWDTVDFRLFHLLFCT